jgi:hypothetical protein
MKCRQKSVENPLGKIFEGNIKTEFSYIGYEDAN